MSVSKLPRWRVVMDVRQDTVDGSSRWWTKTVLGHVIAKDRDGAIDKVMKRWPTFWHMCINSREYSVIVDVVRERRRPS